MRRLLTLIVLVLLAAACGSGSNAKGRVEVRQRIAGHLYIEGSVGYVQIEDGSSTVFRGRIGPDGVTVSLDPGAYRLDTYQRLCIGNCSHLGPPVDRCGAAIRVRSDATTSAVVELTPASNSCTVAVG